MATDIQYRAKSNGANLRTEPYISASFITTIAPGSIIHLDPERSAEDIDNHTWLPVVFVRGWVRADVVEALE